MPSNRGGQTGLSLPTAERLVIAAAEHWARVVRSEGEGCVYEVGTLLEEAVAEMWAARERESGLK